MTNSIFLDGINFSYIDYTSKKPREKFNKIPNFDDSINSKKFIFKRHELFKKLYKISNERKYTDLLLSSDLMIFFANNNGENLSQFAPSMQKCKVSDKSLLHFISKNEFLIELDFNKRIILPKSKYYRIFHGFFSTFIEIPLTISEENKLILYKKSLVDKLKND